MMVRTCAVRIALPLTVATIDEQMSQSKVAGLDGAVKRGSTDQGRSRINAAVGKAIYQLPVFWPLIRH